MSTKRLITFGGIILTISLGIVIFNSATATSIPAPAPWPALKATTEPDKDTVEQLRTLVQNYYEITGLAARNFDISGFPAYLMDDPRLSLEAWQVEEMHNLQAQGNGMLSYESAFYGGWKLGAEKLEQLEAKAKAEGRELTKDEIISVAGSVVIPAPRRTDPMPTVKVPINFSNVIIDGSQAEVTYQAFDQEFALFCEKTPEGWKIAGMHVLTGIVEQS